MSDVERLLAAVPVAQRQIAHSVHEKKKIAERTVPTIARISAILGRGEASPAPSKLFLALIARTIPTIPAAKPTMLA